MGTDTTILTSVSAFAEVYRIKYGKDHYSLGEQDYTIINGPGELDFMLSAIRGAPDVSFLLETPGGRKFNLGYSAICGVARVGLHMPDYKNPELRIAIWFSDCFFQEGDDIHFLEGYYDLKSRKGKVRVVIT